MELEAIESPIVLPTIEEHRCVATTVSADDETLRLWLPEDYADATMAREGGRLIGRSCPGRLLITNLHWTTERDLLMLAARFPVVEVLPGGRTLVVGTRCSRNDDNATIYKSDGSVEARFCL